MPAVSIQFPHRFFAALCCGTYQSLDFTGPRYELPHTFKWRVRFHFIAFATPSQPTLSFLVTTWDVTGRLVCHLKTHPMDPFSGFNGSKSSRNSFCMPHTCGSGAVCSDVLTPSLPAHYRSFWFNNTTMVVEARLLQATVVRLISDSDIGTSRSGGGVILSCHHSAAFPASEIGEKRREETCHKAEEGCN